MVQLAQRTTSQVQPGYAKNLLKTCEKAFWGEKKKKCLQGNKSSRPHLEGEHFRESAAGPASAQLFQGSVLQSAPQFAFPVPSTWSLLLLTTTNICQYSVFRWLVRKISNLRWRFHSLFRISWVLRRPWPPPSCRVSAQSWPATSCLVLSEASEKSPTLK